MRNDLPAATIEPVVTEADIETPVGPDVSLVDSDMPVDSAGFDTETANALQTRSTGRSVARATAGMVPIYIARFVIGFVANPLIAHSLGLRWQADAYAVSSDILQRLWLVFEKVVNPAFLPCFAGALKEEGEERAWRFASTAILLTALALIVVTPLAWWGMPTIVDIYTPRPFNPTPQDLVNFPLELALTIKISRMLLLGLFFLGMSSLTYVILNGYKRFALAALGDALWKVGILVGAGVVIALHTGPSKALAFIAGGFVVGSFLKLFPHLLALKGKWRFFRPRIDWNDPLTRRMLLLAIPLLCGIFVSEARGIYLQRLAGDESILHVDKIEAGRAALKWSRTITDALIQMFPYALSIGIFPYLADLARERDKQPLTDTLLKALRVCFFVFGPITAILIALRFPLLRAVWESGRLTQQDTIAMSAPFIGFTLGLIAAACEMMLNQTFYAMTNAWTPTLIGIITSVLAALIGFIGIQSGFGLLAIAGAESISKTVKCLLMWILLRPQLGNIRARENCIFIVKVAVGAIVAALVAALLAKFVAPHSSHAAHFKIKMLLAVTIAGCGGLAGFLVYGALVKIQEVQQLSRMAGKVRAKLAGA
jgi:putative peptidoglycan lipid II flippase